MAALVKDADTDEAALKWLALAALHGINMNADEISIKKSADGRVKVTAEYREAELPFPGQTIGEKIMGARGIGSPGLGKGLRASMP